MTAAACDLVIDVGNHRAKLALFDQHGIVRHAVVEVKDDRAMLSFIASINVRRVAIGSVADGAMEAWWSLGSIAPVTLLTGTSAAPIQNAYGSPLTLGVDRLANAVAASAMFPGRPTMAIDLGTCITYDLVDDRATYLGGAISPGMHLRARAMHEHSARLPMVDPASRSEEGSMVGTNTGSAMLSGIYRGIQHELDGWITGMRYQYPSLAVVLTGGDALRFVRGSKSGIFADPLLTLRGLHALLDHQSHPADPVRGN